MVTRMKQIARYHGRDRGDEGAGTKVISQLKTTRQFGSANRRVNIMFAMPTPANAAVMDVTPTNTPFRRGESVAQKNDVISRDGFLVARNVHPLDPAREAARPH
jgi:hypothetical protein